MSESRRSGKPEWQKRISKERIRILFERAEEGRDRPGYAKRYVNMAVKISMRYNVTIPSDLKRRFCSKCHAYLFSGNSSVRTNPRQKAVIINCKDCGNVMRYPYRKERQARKII